MRNIKRRDRMKIYGDILSILYQKTQKEKIILTQVQLRTNVPYDRLKKYIKELAELELIVDVTSMKLTEKGKQYLREYQTVLDFMERMGLIYQKGFPHTPLVIK